MADDISDLVLELSDRAAIVDLAVGYARALDAKDWDALGELFTDDVRWEYPGRVAPVEGPEAIIAMMKSSLLPLDATQHLNSNHLVSVHGDEAEHSCYFQAQHVRLGTPGGDKFLGAGRYDDRLRRTPHGWRIAHRSLTSVWTEGNPAVLRR